MRKVLIVAACLMLVFAVYLSSTAVNPTTPAAVAKHADTQTYSGTVYIAGMGGHFSAAKVMIDPADPGQPIKVLNLDRIVIGTKATHPVHDPRIDVNDKTKMYWSTYKIDKSAGERVGHVGLSDLATGKKLKDEVVPLDDRAKWTGALYCGSGQTAKSFMPVTMTGEAYIDVRNKSDLSLKKRVFFDKKGYKNNYLFFHGTNSPDMKTFAMTINRTSEWANPTTPGKATGEIDMLLLDLPALERGRVKILAKERLTGQPGKSLTFRQDFTPDGKYLLQSAADRFYLLDGKTMRLLDEEIMDGGANHDAISSPDGKYALLTLRVKVDDPTEQGKTATDGMLQLYDIEAKRVVGDPVSVCLGCHAKMGMGGSTVLCGADVNWD